MIEDKKTCLEKWRGMVWMRAKKTDHDNEHDHEHDHDHAHDHGRVAVPRVT